MKIAFIGFGKSAHRYHLPFIDHSEQFDVIGYYNRNGLTFEMPYPKYKDIQHFDNLESLLSSNAQIICVTTPADTHFDYAKMAILAGKHVIVEKPFCETLCQAKELYQLAEKHRVKITPYQNRRYDSDFLTARQILSSKDLGPLLEIESNHTHYRPDKANVRGGRLKGSIYGHAVHFIDQIVALFGQPDRIISDTCNQVNYLLGDGCNMDATHPEA